METGNKHLLHNIHAIMIQLKLFLLIKHMQDDIMNFEHNYVESLKSVINKNELYMTIFRLNLSIISEFSVRYLQIENSKGVDMKSYVSERTKVLINLTFRKTWKSYGRNFLIEKTQR